MPRHLGHRYETHRISKCGNYVVMYTGTTYNGKRDGRGTQTEYVDGKPELATTGDWMWDKQVGCQITKGVREWSTGEYEKMKLIGTDNFEYIAEYSPTTGVARFEWNTLGGIGINVKSSTSSHTIERGSQGNRSVFYQKPVWPGPWNAGDVTFDKGAGKVYAIDGRIYSLFSAGKTTPLPRFNWY